MPKRTAATARSWPMVWLSGVSSAVVLKENCAGSQRWFRALGANGAGTVPVFVAMSSGALSGMSTGHSVVGLKVGVGFFLDARHILVAESEVMTDLVD